MSERITVRATLDFADDVDFPEGFLRELQEGIAEVVNLTLTDFGLTAALESVAVSRGDGLGPSCRVCGRPMSWDPHMDWWHCPHDHEDDDAPAAEMGESVPS